MPLPIIITIAAYILAAATILTTAVPLIPTGIWQIRIWEFPRIHIAAAGAIAAALIALACLTPNNTNLTLALPTLIVTLAAVAYQLGNIIPLTRYWPAQVHDAPTDQPRSFRLLISNLKYDNNQHRQALEIFQQADPDILFLIEIDDNWHHALEPLRTQFPHTLEDIRPGGWGLALWSKLQLNNTQTKTLISEKRPSLWAEVTTNDGTSLNLIGLHPTPPALPKDQHNGRHDSNIRDAELLTVAKHIAEHKDQPWIVAGDLNDVAWSHTTKLFRKISGLHDPRIGRKLLNTFHAQHPLVRYPLDHIFIPPGTDVSAFQRIKVPGSDHFAVLVDIHLEPNDKPQPQSDPDTQSEADEKIEDGKQDSAEDSGKSPH